MSCRALESNRTWPRKRLIPMSVATRTVTSNPATAICPGPSTVTVGCGGGPGGGAGRCGRSGRWDHGCATKAVVRPSAGLPRRRLHRHRRRPAPNGVESATPPNGVLRERLSVPYQNSVESEAARGACG